MGRRADRSEDRFHDVDVSQFELEEARPLGHWGGLAHVLSRLQHPVATIAAIGISGVAWHAKELTPAQYIFAVGALATIALAEILSTYGKKWERQRTSEPADPRADQDYAG